MRSMTTKRKRNYRLAKGCELKCLRSILKMSFSTPTCGRSWRNTCLLAGMKVNAGSRIAEKFGCEAGAALKRLNLSPARCVGDYTKNTIPTVPFYRRLKSHFADGTPALHAPHSEFLGSFDL